MWGLLANLREVTPPREAASKYRAISYGWRCAFLEEGKSPARAEQGAREVSTSSFFATTKRTSLH